MPYLNSKDTYFKSIWGQKFNPLKEAYKWGKKTFYKVKQKANDYVKIPEDKPSVRRMIENFSKPINETKPIYYPI